MHSATTKIILVKFNTSSSQPSMTCLLKFTVNVPRANRTYGNTYARTRTHTHTHRATHTHTPSSNRCIIVRLSCFVKPAETYYVHS